MNYLQICGLLLAFYAIGQLIWLLRKELACGTNFVITIIKLVLITIAFVWRKRHFLYQVASEKKKKVRK